MLPFLIIYNFFVEVDAFHKDKVSPNVLRRLLYQGVIYHVTTKKKMKPDKALITTGVGFIIIEILKFFVYFSFYNKHFSA